MAGNLVLFWGVTSSAIERRMNMERKGEDRQTGGGEEGGEDEFGRKRGRKRQNIS